MHGSKRIFVSLDDLQQPCGSRLLGLSRRHKVQIPWPEYVHVRLYPNKRGVRIRLHSGLNHDTLFLPFSNEDAIALFEIRHVQLLTFYFTPHGPRLIVAQQAVSGGVEANGTSGQSVAAPMLGMPPSTLDSKIKTLRIATRPFTHL